MRAFLASLIAVVVIGIGAMVVLREASQPSAEVYQSHTGSVRLDPTVR